MAEALRPHLDAPVFFVAVMAQHCVLCVAAAAALSPMPLSLGFDAQRGLLGWLYPSAGRLGAELWLALAADLYGNLGLIGVMKYISSVIVAVALLLSPIVATLEGLSLGTEKLPGPWTMGGAGVIIVASLVIAADSHQQSTTVELQQM